MLRLRECYGPVRDPDSAWSTCPDGREPDWEALGEEYGQQVTWDEACRKCELSYDLAVDRAGEV